MLSAGPALDADNFVIVRGDHYDAHKRDRTPALLIESGVDKGQSLWALLS